MNIKYIIHVLNKTIWFSLLVILLVVLFPSDIHAAFPSVTSGTNATSVTDSTTHNITMPATVAAGDLLLVVVSYEGASSITDPSAPSGWTKEFSLSQSSNTYWLAVFTKDAVGNEDGTSVNFASSVSSTVAAQVYRISAASWYGTLASGVDVDSTGASGSFSNSLNPPSFSASWGSADNLWLVVAGQGDDNAISSYPTNYTGTGITVVGNGTTNDNNVASAWRNLASASEDIGTITFGGFDPSVATTVVIRPAPSNTPPSFSSQPVKNVQGFTRAGTGNTPWVVQFTATDPEQTGANELTYTLKKNSDSSTISGPTTFTSGAVQTFGVNYNASNLASGSNTLRVDVGDGTDTTASSTFTLDIDNAAPTGAGTISTTPNPVGSNNQYTVTFTSPDDVLSTASNELFYTINTSSGGGASVISGGSAIQDGGSNPVGEEEDKAFDNNTSTKWLILGSSTGTIGYDFSGSTTAIVSQYNVTSANDSPDRDPKNWTFQGYDGSTWTTLDTRTGVYFPNRFQSKDFYFSNSTGYQSYRLNITANNGAGDTQLSELKMYASLANGTATDVTSKTTGTITDSTLTNGATRYVRLCDGANNCADFSFTVSKGIPATTDTLSRSNLTPFSATLNGQANPNGTATTGYFRYWTSDPGTCSDTGGTRVPSSSGTALGTGSSNVAYAQGITGLTPGTTYYYCAISDNGSVGVGTVSNFTTAGGGQCASVPEAGNYTLASSCVFQGTGADGVDNGSGTTNTALMTIQSGQSLTLGPNQTIAYGSISKQGASIVKFSGAILKKGAIWVPDTDDDGYPDATFAPGSQVISTSKPAGYVRRALANGLSPDCNGSDADVFRTNVGGNTALDGDQDGYYTTSPTGNCVGASTTIGGRTYYSDSSGNYTYVLSSGGLGSSDCSAADGTKWATMTGYTDSDGDGVGAGSNQNPCSGAALPSGYSATNTDCLSADATKWQNLQGYNDGDSDTYRATTTSNVCSGNSLPSGADVQGTDCLDSDSDVYQMVSVNDDDDLDNYTEGVGYTSTCVGGISSNHYRNTSGTYTWQTSAQDTGDSDCLDSGGGAAYVYQTLTVNDDDDGDNYTEGSGYAGACVGSIVSNHHRDTSGTYTWQTSAQDTGNSDCDDNSASTWQNLTGYTDGDGDTYRASGGQSVCSGSSLPGGYYSTQGTVDCNDSNSNVKPGQTSYFTTSAGGSFDYNCDSSETPQSAGSTLSSYSYIRTQSYFGGACQNVSGSIDYVSGTAGCGVDGYSCSTGSFNYFDNTSCTGGVNGADCSYQGTTACR